MRYVYLISNSLFGFRAKTLMLDRQIAIAFELCICYHERIREARLVSTVKVSGFMLRC